MTEKEKEATATEEQEEEPVEKEVPINDELRKPNEEEATVDGVVEPEVEGNVYHTVEKEVTTNVEPEVENTVNPNVEREITTEQISAEAEEAPEEALKIAEDVLATLRSKDVSEDHMPISALRGMKKKRNTEKTTTQSTKSKKTKKQMEKGKRVLIDEDSCEEEIAAPPPRKTVVCIPSKKKMPLIPMDRISFHSLEGAAKWENVQKRVIFPEKELSKNAKELPEIMSLLEHAELMQTVTNIGPYFPLLVREFIVNLPSSFNDPEDPEFEKVFVRGKCFDISSDVINDFLGRSAGAADPKPHMNQVAREITGRRNRIWPSKGNVAAADLTAKYSVLYRIGAANWAPTKNETSIKERTGCSDL